MGDECYCGSCELRERLQEPRTGGVFTITVSSADVARLNYPASAFTPLWERQAKYIDWLEHQIGYFPHAVEKRKEFGL